MTHGPREWLLGSHTIRFEPPDIFWVRFQGPLLLEHATRAVSIYREVGHVRPFIFVAEVEEMGRMDPEAGRYLSEHLPSAWTLCSVYIGARLLHRALARGVALASLLTSHRDDRAVEKIHYVSTREQAYAVIAEARTRQRGT